MRKNSLFGTALPLQVSNRAIAPLSVNTALSTDVSTGNVKQPPTEVLPPTNTQSPNYTPPAPVVVLPSNDINQAPPVTQAPISWFDTPSPIGNFSNGEVAVGGSLIAVTLTALIYGFTR